MGIRAAAFVGLDSVLRLQLSGLSMTIASVCECFRNILKVILEVILDVILDVILEVNRGLKSSRAASMLQKSICCSHDSTAVKTIDSVDRQRPLFVAQVGWHGLQSWTEVVD